MFESIDELIELNLQRLKEARSNRLAKNQFIDKNQRPLDSYLFPKKLEEKGLIEIVGRDQEICLLTEFGHKISNSGGWLKHLDDVKKKESELIKKNEEREKLEINNLEVDYKLKKWQLKTFWWIFGLAIFGGLYSIYDLGSNIIKAPKKEKYVDQKQQDFLLDKINKVDSIK